MMSEVKGTVKIEEHGGVLIFLPEGDLGSLSFTDDQPALNRMLQRVDGQSTPRAVIDMSGLTFADSTLLAVLVSVWKRITSKGGKMVLASVPVDIAEVLRYTKLDTLWFAYPSRAKAIAAVKAS